MESKSFVHHIYNSLILNLDLMQITQSKNPKKVWFCWGIAAKRSINGYAYNDDSFYGVTTYNQWRANGSGIDQDNFDIEPFKFEQGEVDIFLDATNGIFKLCVVGMKGEDKEIVIEGLYKSQNNDGWVPNIVFGSGAVEEEARVCEIDSDLYGEQFDIAWD